MNESISPLSLEKIIQQAAAIPYNSAAGLFRLMGSPQPSIYGEDCLGQLKIVADALPPNTPVAYLPTTFRNVNHVAAIVKGVYIDPFLCLTEPIPLSQLETGQEITAKTLASNQKVKARLKSPNELVVRLVRQPGRYEERNLIDYHYDCSAATTAPPEDEAFIRLTIPYVFHFVSPEGRHIRAIFEIKHRRWNIFLVNGEAGETLPNIDDYCEGCLREQFNLSLEILQDYFLQANEVQRYLLWQKNNFGSGSWVTLPG